MMIGIVTPYKTLNYGTKLQAYAMQELMKQYGKCEIVNFNTSKDFRLSAIMGKLSIENIKNKLKINKQKETDRYYEKTIKNRNKSISQFDSNYIFSPLIKTNKELLDYSKKYDCIICGSDQLWSPANVKNDWFTLNAFSNNIKKVSFSASFGVNKIPKKMKKKYYKFLKEFNAIATRESEGKKIVEDIINKDVTVTLDPTLMIDKCHWSELADKSIININEPYVFCYFLGTNEKHRDFAFELAKKNNIKMVNLPFIKEDNKADRKYEVINLDEVSPIDFINLIKNATYVCTDSFHGTVFSIIFNKQFAVFERFSKNDSNSTNSRIYSILKLLCLENQLISEDVPITINQFTKNKIEYKKTNELLNQERQNSFDYLNYALGGKE